MYCSMLASVAKLVQVNSEDLKECKMKVQNQEEQMEKLRKESKDTRDCLVNQERYKRCIHTKHKKEKVNINFGAEVVELL